MFIKEAEPLSKHTNFRIGGPARFFVEAKHQDELMEAVSFCKEKGMEMFILGGGSNTLVSDTGFDGMVIKIAMRSFCIDGNTVCADAGVLSAALARATAHAGLFGFTWAISLPGTIGGAVRGNAGCFGGEMKDVVTNVLILRDNVIRNISDEELDFGYRHSLIKHSNDIVLSATLTLEFGDTELLLKQLDETLSRRKESQPLYAGSAGCLFKNVEIQTEEEMQRLRAIIDIPIAMCTRKCLSVGWVIDQLGLKGERIGDAQISQEHGNFVINRGHATAKDVTQLIDVMKNRAYHTLGIHLQEEVRYLGF